jgi:hypothetical protein
MAEPLWQVIGRMPLGGAVAAWPLAAGAQQRAMPVIGYLSGRTADSDASMLVSLRRGLGSSAERLRLGRSRCARSSATACGASACSCLSTKTIP